jgi:hypothetical protein
MERGFDNYLDDLILAVADRQAGPQIQPTNVLALHQELLPERPEPWAHLAPGEMERRGWGRDLRPVKGTVSHLNGGGASRAQQVRAARLTKGLRQRVREVSRAEWIAVAALLVALTALFR